MESTVFQNLLRLVGVTAILALAACGTGEPIDPDMISKPDEMQPGPGVFSGEDGEFVLNG